MNSKTTAYFGIVGGMLFVSTVILSSFQFEEYSHVSQYISEAYAFGTPYGPHLRFLGYFPSGFLLFFFGVNAHRFLKKSNQASLGFFGFAVFYGLGTVLVSIFPCDAGCNKEFVNPSISQIIHNILSVATYTIVPCCLLLVGWGLKKTSSFLGVASLVFGAISGIFALLLFSDPTGNFIGLFQRIIEASILIWVFLIAGTLLKSQSIQEDYYDYKNL